MWPVAILLHITALESSPRRVRNPPENCFLYPLAQWDTTPFMEQSLTGEIIFLQLTQLTFDAMDRVISP